MKSTARARTPVAILGWGLVTAALIAAPLGIAGPAVADDSTSVLSSTFDGGSYAPWFSNGGGALSLVADPDGTGQALKVSGISADYVGAAVDLTKLLTPGVKYSISFEARLADAAQPAGSVHFTVDDGSYTWVSGGAALSASSWTTISGSYTLAAGATKANMYLNSSGSAPFPDVLLDNVTITGPSSGGGTPPGGGTCTPTAAKSLVSADFDDQALDGLQQDGSPTSLTYEHVDGAAGDYAVRVNGRSDNYFGVQTAPGALSTLAAGDTVTVSAKVRLATSTTATTSARLVAVPGYSWVGNQSGVSTTAWTTITGTYTVPDATDTSTLKFYIGTDALTDATATYDYYVNDFTVTVPGKDCGGSGGSTCTYPTGDTIIDSAFENGSADGWVGRDDGHGTATVAVADGGHDSAHALAVTNRAGQGQGVGHDITCLLQPGTTYQFSGWVKFADGQPTDDVWLSLANTVGGSTSYSTLGQFTGVTNSGWTQITQKFTLPSSSDSALLYVETKYYSDGSAGNTSNLLFDDLQVTKPAPLVVQDITPIKDTLPFPVGAAVSSAQLAAGQLLVKHFDQVTPENTMKPEAWYNADHSFVTTNADADALMTFARENDLRVYGHNLSWYQQTPDWFFQNDQGAWLTDSTADQQVLRQRLHDHVFAVAKYLSDKFGLFGSATNPLVSFDVVNEAVSDNSGDPDGLRQSHWYQVLGESYIEDAFHDADQAFNQTYAAPGAAHPIALFINDYNTEQAGKRARLQSLIGTLVADGVPVDGVGHQFHVTMSTPVSTLKDAIDAFAGIQSNGHQLYQAVTELDVPTGTPVTTANQIDQGYYYKSVFDMLRQAQTSYGDIYSATVWGLLDGQSWRASAGAPLLFDDDLQAKPAYCGVTDQPLPAKQLSAIVFAQDASDVDVTSAGATTDVEWSKLPLHPVGDDAGFQLRWSPDHLTAYVSVDDATVGATDAATFTWGTAPGATATVKRDGTVTGAGVTAVVTQTSTGWKAVVDLPTSPALTQTSTPSFDVGITDGTTTDGWNTPGTLGTLQLVEPLSYTTIPEATAAPTIDGTKDAAWSGASTVNTAKLVTGAADGATATVSSLWKGDYLYVLADVTDPTIDTSSPNAYEQDSVEIFTDPGNAKNGSYRPDDAQMRINADNVHSFGAGDENAQSARLTSATSRTATGYIVEARIDLLENGGRGAFEGLDFQVNDGTAGARTSVHNWAQPDGTGYQTTARWGVAQLVAPPAPPVAAPVVTTQPVSASAPLGGTVHFAAAASGYPVPTVTWQRQLKGSSRWTTVAGATAPALDVTASASVDGARYRAVFANTQGTATTKAATLTVTKAKPVITTQPASVSVPLRRAVQLTASASGYPTPTVSWQVQLKGTNRWVTIPGAHDTTLRLLALRGLDGARYRAVFTNSQGSTTSNAATLTITRTALVVTTQPRSTSGAIGSTVRFTADASGYPDPTVSWQRLAKGSTVWKSIAGAHSTTLSVKVANGDDGAKYRAVFANSVGTATSNTATLSVTKRR